MLPAAHRLRESGAFRETSRAGRRGGSRTLVVHVREGVEDADPVRVGFVVSKAVGDAVTRNRVKRRLRHLVRSRLAGGSLPGTGVVVVRALPSAAAASSARLDRDLQTCLVRAAAG